MTRGQILREAGSKPCTCSGSNPNGCVAVNYELMKEAFRAAGQRASPPLLSAHPPSPLPPPGGPPAGPASERIGQPAIWLTSETKGHQAGQWRALAQQGSRFGASPLTAPPAPIQAKERSGRARRPASLGI